MSERLHTPNLFLRMFPAPRFLQMSGLGIDISRHTIRVVELKRIGSRIVPGRCSERKIPPNVIYAEDFATNEELRTGLISLKKELDIEFAHVSLPEDKAYIFKLTLPEMPESQIRQSIEFQLEENVPISAADAIFDYAVIPKEKTDVPQADKTIDVAVSVFPRNLIQSVSELFHAAGIIPVAFHLSADTVARALIKDRDQGTYLVANLGSKSTGIYVISSGVVQFTSTLTFGSDALTSAIEKHFNVSHEEAMKIKKGESTLKNKEAMELFYSLVNTASALRDEMNRIVSYWQNHMDKDGQAGKTIEKIILCGGGANLPGFDEYVSASMEMRVEVGDVWGNAFSFDEAMPKMNYSDSLSYTSAVGAALAAIE